MSIYLLQSNTCLRVRSKLPKKGPIRKSGRQLMFIKRGITSRPAPLARLVWFILSTETQVRVALRQGASILHAACEDGCGYHDCVATAHLRAGNTVQNAKDRGLDVEGSHRNRGVYRGYNGRFIFQSDY